MKWSIDGSKNWVASADCFCDEKIREFEINALQFIIGAAKRPDGIYYGLKLRYNPELIAVPSNEVTSKWPDLLIELLESQIQFVILRNLVSSEQCEKNPSNAVGQPLSVIGKLFRNILHYVSSFSLLFALILHQSFHRLLFQHVAILVVAL